MKLAEAEAIAPQKQESQSQPGKEVDIRASSSTLPDKPIPMSRGTQALEESRARAVPASLFSVPARRSQTPTKPFDNWTGAEADFDFCLHHTS
jgi:hypothetical protein